MRSVAPIFRVPVSNHYDDEELEQMVPFQQVVEMRYYAKVPFQRLIQQDCISFERSSNAPLASYVRFLFCRFVDYWQLDLHPFFIINCSSVLVFGVIFLTII